MNNRFEFDPEASGDQPFSFEGEQEIKRRGGRPAAGRKTGAARKADPRRKPAAKPRPRPGKKFPIRVPVAALPLPVWPVLSPEPAKEPRGQEPRQDSAPSGSPPPPPERDQAREGSEYTRWAQITLNKALNLNLQTNGVMDDATRNAIRSFQQREGLQVTGFIGPDTEQALIAAGNKAAPATEAPPSNDAGPSRDDGPEQELWPGPWRRRRLKRAAGDAGPEQESWPRNEAEGEFGDIFSRIKSGVGDVFSRAAEAIDGGSRIIDLTAKADKSERKSIRDPKKVYALVLHQMACCFKVKDPLTRFLKMAPHFAILPDGRILQLHPITAYTWASNGFNKGSVAVEFAGNFPNTRGKWWNEKEAGKNQVTKEQIEAGRYLARHLIRTMGLTHILAHRQSSATRENDPGPDIWYHVGQWAVDNLGLKDGGPGFKVGDGNPIPDLWRTWGKAKPNPEFEVEMAEEFDFSQLPQSIFKALSGGLEGPAIKLAIALGYRNENELTDMVFHARHPGRFGAVITRGEPGYNELIGEWLSIRNSIVRPALSGAKPATPAPAGTPTGTPDVVKVRGITVARQIAPKIDALLAAAETDGVRLGGGGFRTPQEQIALRKKHCGGSDYDIYEKPADQCSPPTAKPGRSNHERGLAIDFTYNGKTIPNENKESNPGYRWLVANAHRFGLKNLKSEAWHWSVDGR
jgi:N-acetylmuramoyl-L-alanine amidase-like protein/putative peptidoglycan binding protein/D-alanyl-D-alanine carboxypeptidase-like protein